MRVLKAQQGNIFVNIDRGEAVGKIVVLAVNDAPSNYIEVSIEVAKDKYGYAPIDDIEQDVSSGRD